MNFNDLTKGQKRVLKLLGTRELNRRKDPLKMPTNASERKPFDALVEEGLVTVTDDVVKLTEEGRDFSLMLMR